MNADTFEFEDIEPIFPNFSVIGIGEVGRRAVDGLLANPLGDYRPVGHISDVTLTFSVIDQAPSGNAPSHPLTSEADIQLAILIADPEDAALPGIVQELASRQDTTTLLLAVSPTRPMSGLQAIVHGGEHSPRVDCALAVAGNDTPVDEVRERLVHLIAGLAGVLSGDGICTDYSDLRTVLMAGGQTMAGSAWADGPGRATRAVEAALAGRWPADGRLELAGHAWVVIHTPSSWLMDEIYEVINYFGQRMGEDAMNVLGISDGPDMYEGVRVTFMAMGIEKSGPA